jgi:comEA protein
MQFLNFTPQETKALIFLLTALLVGSGITLYKRTHPQFAPELMTEKQEVVARLQTETSPDRPQQRTKIDLNQATTAQLQLLPGVGPALSQRIVEYRKSRGPFQKTEDLMQVRGIGLKTFEKMKDYLTIEQKGEKAQR